MYRRYYGSDRKTFEQNTLGIRINTLLHQYFINGGKLTEDQVNKTTFTKKLWS